MSGALPTPEQWGAAAPEYEAYLDSPSGRLRTELAWRTLRAALPAPQGTPPPLVLDLGCGPGRTTARLAGEGYRVHGWEPAAAMIERARARVAALDRETAARVALSVGTLDDALAALGPGCADAVVCHNILEFVPDPAAACHTLATLLRPGGVLSILMLNRWSEVLRAAINTGSAGAVLAALPRRALPETMTGTTRRAYDQDEAAAWLAAAGLRVAAIHGNRALSDFLPGATYEEQLAVELAASAAAPAAFARLARQVQLIATRSAQAYRTCRADYDHSSASR